MEPSYKSEIPINVEAMGDVTPMTGGRMRRSEAMRRGPRRGTIVFALVVGLSVSASVAQAVSYVESGEGADLGIAQTEAADSIDAVEPDRGDRTGPHRRECRSDG